MVIPECHPDRRHMARGMCRPCYQHWYKRNVYHEKPRSEEAKARRRELLAERRAAGWQPGKRWHDPAARRAKTLRLYGLTPEEYQALRDAQGDKCAICGRAEYSTWRGKSRLLAIDHDHRTGRVRALLCTGCNLGLGAFGDDPERIRLALAYLERAA